MAEGKYYWLKLKRDFFKRHDIRIIEAMPNGKDYILFYLKLLLESIDHEGKLRFSDTIPYNEQMLSIITNTNIDIVKSAMDIFKQLQMIDVYDDQTIYMAEVDKLIGSETKWAEKKRLQRSKEDNVPRLSFGCPTEIEKEKKKDTEKEEEGEVKDEPENELRCFFSNLFLTDNQIGDLLEKMGLEMFNEYAERLSNYIENHDVTIKSHYATILKWYNEDRAVK